MPLGRGHDHPRPEGAPQGQEEGEERQAPRRHQDGRHLQRCQVPIRGTTFQHGLELKTRILFAKI